MSREFMAEGSQSPDEENLYENLVKKGAEKAAGILTPERTPILSTADEEKQELLKSLVERSEGRSAINHFRLPEAKGEHGNTITSPDGSPVLLDIEGKYVIETEIVKVESYAGQFARVLVPASGAEKIKYVRDALKKLESTDKPDGGEAYKKTVQRAGLMIEVLQEPDYTQNHIEYKEDGEKDDNFEIGKRLSEEFIARLTLHQVYLAFETAPDIKTVGETLLNLRTEHFNALFHIPEVAMAFRLYEIYGREFVLAKGSAVADVRQEIQRAMLAQGFGTKADDNGWAQKIAERFWVATGRAATRDELEVKDPFSDDEEKQLKEGNTRFKGLAAGGPFMLRRLLRFDKWLNYATQAIYPQIELMDGVDLDAGDFFGKRLLSNLEIQYRTELINQNKREGEGIDPTTGELNKETTIMINQIARERVTEITGIQPKPQIVKDESTGLETQKEISGVPQYEWPKESDGLGYLDFSKVQWEKINFGIFMPTSPTPMLDWVIFNLSGPDGVRDALVGKSEGFLRQPSSKSLFALKDAFGYLAGEAFKVKEKLLENFLKLSMNKEKAAKVGLLKINRAVAESTIIESKLDLDLPDEKVADAYKNVLGTKILDEIKATSSYFRFRQGLLAAFWELLNRMVRASISNR